MTQAWLEEVLRKKGFKPEQYRTFGQVQRLSVAYRDIENSVAWKDYMARLEAMKKNISTEILLGTLDKFGNNSDDEKRAVLTYLERMLSFVPALHAHRDELAKKKEQMDKKVGGSIHGFDRIST